MCLCYPPQCSPSTKSATSFCGREPNCQNQCSGDSSHLSDKTDEQELKERHVQQLSGGKWGGWCLNEKQL